MAFPAYVTMENVYFNGTLTPCAVLLGGDPKWLVVYDALDDVSKHDLDTLVSVNGGTLPLTSTLITHTTMLPNGKSWYDTYIGITLFVGSVGPTPPDQIPPATSTTIGGVIVQPNSGLTVDTAGHVAVTPATNTILGAVSIPLNSGLLIDSSGAVTIDPSIVHGDVTWSNVRLVSTTGNDTTATGSFAKPYATITQAVASAASNEWVYVLPGTYHEVLSLGTKNIKILGLTSIINLPSIQVDGIVLSGSSPVYFQNIGITPTGTTAIAVHQVNHIAGFRGVNIVVQNQDDTKIAISTDAVNGDWIGSLTIEGLYIDSGQINVAAGSRYVSLRKMPSDSSVTINVAGGSIDISDVWGINKINHTAGFVAALNVRRLTDGTTAASIVSSADGTTGNGLILNDVGLVSDSGVKASINKTGVAPYVMNGVTRNLSTDVVTGPVLTSYLNQYGQDIMAGYNAVNYTATNASSLYDHLAAIDTKLGTTGTGNVTSVNSKVGAIVIAAGNNISVNNSGSSIVIDGASTLDEGTY